MDFRPNYQSTDQQLYQGSRPENVSYFEKTQRNTVALTQSSKNTLSTEVSPILKSPNSREDASKNLANLMLGESDGLNLDNLAAMDSAKMQQMGNKSHSHKLADPKSNEFNDSFVTATSKMTLDNASIVSETMFTRVQEGDQQQNKQEEEKVQDVEKEKPKSKLDEYN